MTDGWKIEPYRDRLGHVVRVVKHIDTRPVDVWGHYTRLDVENGIPELALARAEATA